ncbi:hypothetical protein AALB_0556 [Agarivorans albus MKT 106]|uniref:Uncharacterized protein n=1 Tax=Agarivorans albus MKT 106 TaxID=1331007 RepID=R9PQU6_AGAAL|nr:hypothetical protein AALB_0556 [Agarivorans albus MKT 106]
MLAAIKARLSQTKFQHQRSTDPKTLAKNQRLGFYFQAFVVFDSGYRR